MIRNFAEAHSVLHEFYNTPGTNTYTLDRMLALMDYLGNPQDLLRVVHIAGTSGKTSTAYYVAGLLEAAGANVGLTVSPHVDEVNERVQINHVPLPEKAFCEALSEFVDIVRASGITPSYFEILVAFAYWEFARQELDYAVVEVGLGGLLDGTNVVTREDKVCIITDIGLDHTNILGKTLAKITKQKVGIVWPENPVFIYKQTPEVMKVIQAVCTQKKAVQYVIAPIKDDFLAKLGLPLFQQRNMHLAKQAVDYIFARDGRQELTHKQIREVSLLQVPARMEIFSLNGKTLIVDGSHNSQKLDALSASIRAKFSGQPISALVAFVSGQDQRWQSGLDALLPLIDGLTVTSFVSEQDMPKRAVDPERIAKYCRERGFTNVNVEADARSAFRDLIKQPEQLLLVTGSFYLLNHIRPLLFSMQPMDVIRSTPII